jgi:hypothetical protein
MILQNTGTKWKIKFWCSVTVLWHKNIHTDVHKGNFMLAVSFYLLIVRKNLEIYFITDFGIFIIYLLKLTALQSQ